MRPPSSTGRSCDHDRADWRDQSTHEASEGAVGYVRCTCGAWLVLLDGQVLAVAGRPRSARVVRR